VSASRRRPRAARRSRFDRATWDPEGLGGLDLAQIEQEPRAQHLAVIVAERPECREQLRPLLGGHHDLLGTRRGPLGRGIRGTEGQALVGDPLIADDCVPRWQRYAAAMGGSRPLAKAGEGIECLDERFLDGIVRVGLPGR
jgi:hypothetical protein